MGISENMSIEKIIGNFDGLIDREAAEMLKEYDIKIKNADGNVGLVAKVLSVGKIKKLTKSIVRNVLIGDESGCCILALWGKKAETKIKEGDVIRIVNGYAKNGYYGKEINVWEDGEIKKMKGEIKIGKCENFRNFYGILEEKYPAEVYINGSMERILMRITVDGREIILINERIKDIKDVEKGCKLTIKWAYVKNGKIYVDDIGRIEAIK